MAHRNVNEYKCDRCGKTFVCADGDPPVGWMTMTAKPLRDVTGEREWEVCDSCYLNTARYLQPTDKPDNGAHVTGSGRLREVTA